MKRERERKQNDRSEIEKTERERERERERQKEKISGRQQNQRIEKTKKIGGGQTYHRGGRGSTDVQIYKSKT